MQVKEHLSAGWTSCKPFDLSSTSQILPTQTDLGLTEWKLILQIKYNEVLSCYMLFYSNIYKKYCEVLILNAFSDLPGSSLGDQQNDWLRQHLFCSKIQIASVPSILFNSSPSF